MAGLLRVYLDTSVFGGYYDEGFGKDSRALFGLIRAGRIVSLVSQMVVGEMSRAPQQVQALLAELLERGAEEWDVNEAATELQEAYLRAGALTRRWEDDAMHVAMATLARADVIASWNFKHMLDPRRCRGFNGVNVALGYGLVSILSPADIVRHLEDEE